MLQPKLIPLNDIRILTNVEPDNDRGRNSSDHCGRHWTPRITRGGIKYLITLVLDDYKQQITQTTEAKNEEIAALHERINRHMEDINFLRETVRKFPDVGGKV